MHGYDPGVEEQKGSAVVHGPGISSTAVEEAPLVDVCPTLCALLDVAPPAASEGRSWLQPVPVEAG